MTPEQVIALIIFGITFFFILTERVHRTVIGLVGAMAMVVTGTMIGFYDAHEALAAIDFNTIGLLFGMMLLVALLEETGVFQFLGIYTARKTKGNPWLLMASLGLLTAFLSMVLDNVTTIILIAPITIIITRLLSISALPILTAEAILSNIGGAGTLVGDPPNIMIGTAAGFSFNMFLIHALPVAIAALFVVLFTLKAIFKKELKVKPKAIERLLSMDPREAIDDPRMLKRLIAIFGLVIILFFLHGQLHLEPSLIALFGASLALLVVRAKEDPQEIIQKTELSVLLFFGSLFVIVGGLEHTELLASIGALITSNAESNLLLTAIAVLWVSAFLSAVVDNIPFTVAMIPIIAFLGTQGIPIDLLWWALVLGVGFGGNGTPIGSSAGLIVMSKSEETDSPVTFKTWMRSGLASTIVSLVVATGALVLYDYIGFVS